MFGDSRFLSCGADSTITPIFAGGLAPVEFAIREQTGIGRDDGSTKLKHQSAVEIGSENIDRKSMASLSVLPLPD